MAPRLISAVGSFKASRNTGSACSLDVWPITSMSESRACAAVFFWYAASTAPICGGCDLFNTSASVCEASRRSAAVEAFTRMSSRPGTCAGPATFFSAFSASRCTSGSCSWTAFTSASAAAVEPRSPAAMINSTFTLPLDVPIAETMASSIAGPRRSYRLVRAAACGPAIGRRLGQHKYARPVAHLAQPVDGGGLHVGVGVLCGFQKKRTHGHIAAVGQRRKQPHLAEGRELRILASPWRR